MEGGLRGRYGWLRRGLGKYGGWVEGRGRYG